MCNLYSVTKGQAAIREFARAMQDTTGNLPPLPGIFPDQMAPVVHVTRNGERELTMMRWGMPPPANLGTRPVTNVRNLNSSFWRGWLKPEWRCLVPVTSFCEYTDSQPKVPHWFALGRGPAAVRLCRHLAALDRHARHQGRSGRRASTACSPS